MSSQLVIAHHDPEFLTLIQNELKADFDLIETAADSDGLLKWVRTDSGQLMIVSDLLPEIPVKELLRRIRSQKSSSDLAILVMTHPLEDPEVASLIESGADEFLFVPFERNQLLARIRALKSRFTQEDAKQVLKDGCYSFGNIRLHLNSYDFYQGEERTHLTPSEFKLLETLFRKRGTILTRDQLIAEVQGKGVVVVDRAIDAHIFSLRKKLGEFSSKIETVRGIGYRFNP